MSRVLDHGAAKRPNRLSSGDWNEVVALSDTEAAKVFDDHSRTDIGAEAEKMRYANSINSLVVRFIRIDEGSNAGNCLLVMERLFGFDFRSHTVSQRQSWIDAFRERCLQLHDAGFVHRHIRRWAARGGEEYDNVLLTADGFRLIDTGNSTMRSKVGDKLFESFVEEERKEIEEFAEYFLER